MLMRSAHAFEHVFSPLLRLFRRVRLHSYGNALPTEGNCQDYRALAPSGLAGKRKRSPRTTQDDAQRRRRATLDRFGECDMC